MHVSQRQTVSHQFTLDNPILESTSMPRSHEQVLTQFTRRAVKLSLEQTPQILQVGRNLLKYTHIQRGVLEPKKLREVGSAIS
jgi:hypothetical protein